MSEIYDLVCRAVYEAHTAFVHFITPNDTGQTGSHQCGYYLSKEATSAIFDIIISKGANIEKTINIEWFGEHEGSLETLTTESHFHYYGVGTRNESRITNFGRDYPFLEESHIGDMLVLVRNDKDYYSGFILSKDDDIENFSYLFNAALDKRNQLVSITGPTPVLNLESALVEFAAKFQEFPDTKIMSKEAEDCFNKANKVDKNMIRNNPDKYLQDWYNTEYDLFKLIENQIYESTKRSGFDTCDELISYSSSLLNRRKSRAGKSLEHHLSSIFSQCGLKFEEQVITENKKKPDFLFPDAKSYHNMVFPADDLVFLGSKTTCKDRWRQVLSEADRIHIKHLFTLQQGVSRNQLSEMKDSNLILVVPKDNITLFNKEFSGNIQTLSQFIAFVTEKQSHLNKSVIV